MANINVERDITKKIAAGLKGWTVLPFGSHPDKITSKTVLTTIDRIEKNPGNPLAGRTIFLTLTLVIPETGVDKRDVLALDALIDLLAVLDGLFTNAKWTGATRGTVNQGRNLGYDVAIEYHYNKES